MDYQEFKTYIKEHIKDYLAERYQNADVSIMAVKKNNNRELDGLQIRLAEENICPSIYLNHYFEDYQNGRNIGDILESIGQIRESHDIKEPFPVEKLFDFESSRDRIIFQAVGMEENGERLADMPHHVEQDMALIYKVLIERGEEIGTISIDHKLMEQMGVDETILYETAMKNTVREFPMTFASLDEVMREMAENEIHKISSDPALSEEMKDFLKGIFQESLESVEPLTPFYVLTNEQKMDGAGVLFYPGIQEMVAERLNGDYFVLPSSIHETLILPDDGRFHFEELRAMVQEVNQTPAMRPEEVLTNQIYSYDKERGCLMPAEGRFSKKQREEPGEKKRSIVEKLHEKKHEAMEKNQGSREQKQKQEPEL